MQMQPEGIAGEATLMAIARMGEALKTAEPVAITQVNPVEPENSEVPTSLPAEKPTPVVQVAAIEIPKDNRQILAELVASPNWPLRGLPAEIVQKWGDFAQEKAPLTEAELQSLGSFLKSWEILEEIAAQTRMVSPERITYQVQGIENSSGIEWLPYATDQGGQNGNPVLMLVIHDSAGNTQGLMVAPVIESLHQQINLDGQTVEYLDEGGRVILLADAHQLDTENPHQQVLNERLEKIYGPSAYVSAKTYPRFHYSIPGLEAAFYGIETSLSSPQIVHLKEALEIFNRPAFEPFKTGLFGKGLAFLAPDRIAVAAGLTYTGTGVIELDRRDLFGNRYYLASVLAHEGSHVLQGSIPDGSDTCKEVLKSEVGNQTIAGDFYAWSAEQLLQGIREQSIGSYHISLWILQHIGLEGPRVDWLINVIYTGQVNGRSVVLDC